MPGTALGTRLHPKSKLTKIIVLVGWCFSAHPLHIHNSVRSVSSSLFYWWGLDTERLSDLSKLAKLAMAEGRFEPKSVWCPTQGSLHYPTLPLGKKQHGINYACMVSILFQHGFSVMVWILNSLSHPSCKSCIPTRPCLGLRARKCDFFTHWTYKNFRARRGHCSWNSEEDFLEEVGSAGPRRERRGEGVEMA